MRRNVLAAAIVALAVGLPSVAGAQAKKILTIEFEGVGQVCLSKTAAKDVARRMRDVVIPAGGAATIVAFSDGNEVTRKRPGITSECITHLVPTGITDHERIAVFRGLQIAEIAQEVGLRAFDGTPIMVIGSQSNYRQTDPASFAIISRRAQGTTTIDRRVEVWISDPSVGSSQGAQIGTMAGGGGGTTVLTPILLPPMAYGGGGGSSSPIIIGGDNGDDSGQIVAGWTLVSLSVVGFVGGAFSFVQASDSESLSRSTVDSAQAIEFQNDADAFKQVGAWSIGVGSGLAILGIVLLATADGDEEEEEEGASVTVGTDGDASSLMLGVEGRW